MAIAIAILILLAVVIIHELGHFLACILARVPVNGLYIGIPCPWKVGFKVGGYPIYLTPILIGAAVDVDEGVLWSKPFPIQALILLAGVLANILTLILVLIPILGLVRGIEVGLWVMAIIAAGLVAFGSGMIPSQEIYGPVMLVATSAQAISVNPGMGSLIWFVTISAVLGVMNLLPIPGLDGGHVLMRVFVKMGMPEVWSKQINKYFLVLLIAVAVIIAVKDSLLVAGI